MVSNELKSIPQYGLTTPRLLIRYYNIGDYDSLYKMLSDKRVFKYLLDEPMADELLVKKYTEFCSSDKGRKSGRLLAVDKVTNQFIGTITVHPRAANLLELGFTLPVDNWGKGYATEMVKAITEYYGKEYDIILRIFEDNLASQNVAKKTGYILESTLVDIKNDERQVIFLYKHHLRAAS